jgi:hypothetical protein
MLRLRQQPRRRWQLLPFLQLPLLWLLLRWRPALLPLSICCKPNLLAAGAICHIFFSPGNLPALLPLPLLALRHAAGLCLLPAAACLLPVLPNFNSILFLLPGSVIPLRCLPCHNSCSSIGQRCCVHLLPPARFLQAGLCRLLQQQP